MATYIRPNISHTMPFASTILCLVWHCISLLITLSLHSAMCSNVCYPVTVICLQRRSLPYKSRLIRQTVAPSNGVVFHCPGGGGGGEGGQLSEYSSHDRMYTHTHMYKQQALLLIGVVTTELAIAQ